MVQRFSIGGTLQAFSLTLVTVEVPPPYSGDSVSSVATIDSNQKLSSLGSDSGWQGLVRVGDLIKFNYQSRLYVIWGPTGATPGQVLQAANAPTAGAPWVVTSTDGFAIAPPTTPSPVPYQIFRQPVKSAVAPLQLPEGTAIDLQSSGTGTSTFSLAAPYQNPMVTFSPSGGTEFVYDGAGYAHPSSAVFFLIGRREGMSDVNFNFGYAVKNPHNIYDLNSLWVSVSPRNGQIVTAENVTMTSPPNPWPGGNATALANALQSARGIAQSAQSMGGR